MHMRKLINKVKNTALLQLYSYYFFYSVTSMSFFIINRRALTILLAVLLIQVRTHQSNNCFKGCQTCDIYVYFMYCTQCFPNRTLDQNTGLCPCRQGLYDYLGTCIRCPNYCLTCNQFSCTSCSQDKFYNNGNCVCKNGLQIDSSGVCYTPSSSLNIPSILGIALGSSAGLICLISMIFIGRKRNFRMFKRNDDDIPERIQHNPIILELRPQFQESSAHETILEPKIQKKWSFKVQACSICLDDSAYCMTECGHFFHEHCIGEWILKRRNCPNCNHPISRMKLVKWCGICKNQVIYPQYSHFYKIGINKNPVNHRQDVPIFWPTCENWQKFDQHIQLK